MLSLTSDLAYSEEISTQQSKRLRVEKTISRSVGMSDMTGVFPIHMPKVGDELFCADRDSSVWYNAMYTVVEVFKDERPVRLTIRSGERSKTMIYENGVWQIPGYSGGFIAMF